MFELLGAGLSDFLAKLCLGFLQTYLQRKDIEDKVKLEIANGMYKHANDALKFKSDSQSHSDGGASLHTQGGTITLPSDNTRTQGPPN